jgi:hypothetical protein
MPIGLMLATLSARREFGDEWLLERKFDGERCIAHKVGDVVRLESRTGKELTSTYPEVHAAVAAQHMRELVLDGEVVAFEAEQTSFGRLQQRLGVTGPPAELIAAFPVVYCVFDLLELDGEDLRGRPLLQRRATLTTTVLPRTGLQLSEAWSGESQRRFAEACQSGWEGLIAKHVDATYSAGRSQQWLKLKCTSEQELVVGGYTDPAGSRTDFGALATTRLAACTTRAKLALVTARPPSVTLGGVCVPSRRRSRHSSMPDRFRAERTGRDRSWSPRSALPNGRATADFDNRGFWAYAMTSRRARSSANDPFERLRPLLLGTVTLPAHSG